MQIHRFVTLSVCIGVIFISSGCGTDAAISSPNVSAQRAADSPKKDHCIVGWVHSAYGGYGEEKTSSWDDELPLFASGSNKKTLQYESNQKKDRGYYTNSVERDTLMPALCPAGTNLMIVTAVKQTVNGYQIKHGKKNGFVEDDDLSWPTGKKTEVDWACYAPCLN